MEMLNKTPDLIEHQRSHKMKLVFQGSDMWLAYPGIAVLPHIRWRIK